MASALTSYLEGIGLFPDEEWLSQCLSFLRNDPNFDALSLERQSDLIYMEFLQSDFSTSARRGCLPANMKDKHKDVVQGRFVVQVDEVVDIGAGFKERYRESSGGRCLKLHITDGKQRVVGMEYRKLNALSVLGSAGIKVAITDPLVRRGIMMLRPENMAVLGGQAAELEEARQRMVSRWLQPAGPIRRQSPGQAQPRLPQLAAEAAWSVARGNGPGAINHTGPPGLPGAGRGPAAPGPAFVMLQGAPQGLGGGGVAPGQAGAAGSGAFVRAAGAVHGARPGPGPGLGVGLAGRNGPSQEPPGNSHPPSRGPTPNPSGSQHSLPYSNDWGGVGTDVYSSRSLPQSPQSAGRGGGSQRSLRSGDGGGGGAETQATGGRGGARAGIVGTKRERGAGTGAAASGGVITIESSDEEEGARNGSARRKAVRPSAPLPSGSPFSYLADLRRASSGAGGRALTKCSLSSMSRLSYKDESGRPFDEYRAHITIEDGSCPPASAVIAHAPMLRLMGKTPSELVRALTAGSAEEKEAVKKRITAAVNTIRLFEGVMDVEAVEGDEVLVVHDMKPVPASAANELLARCQRA